MAVTLREVVAYLDCEEPDYAEAAMLGREAIPHLLNLVSQGDPNLASKATYLASMIDSDESFKVIEVAANSPNPVLRVAAAGSLRGFSVIPSQTAQRLLTDSDASIRLTALKSLPNQVNDELKALVSELSLHDSNPNVQNLARQLSVRWR